MNELATIPFTNDEANANDPDIRLIDRFQTLEPGHYWRRKGEATRNHSAGVVLLLLDVVVFDGKPHTVHLATHPLAGGDGRFEILVSEFLDEWEFAPDGAEVRDRELRQLQMEIAEANAELLAGQVNPALIAPAIQKDLDAWTAKREESGKDDADAARANGEAPLPLDEPTAGSMLMVQGGRVRTDLGFIAENRLTQADVAALRVTVEREAVIAESKVRWLTTRTDAIATKVRAMTPFFKEKAAVALAQTSHVRKFTNELMKGLASLDLYTGKDVEVVTIKEGAPASANEPLTLMQRKLFIEEELAVWADLDTDFDYSKVDLFDQHIANSSALLQQICPTPRCVVAVAMRRQSVDYENVDPQEWMRRNRENKAVFLLVRNGENIHRVYSGEPTHEMVARLFPSRQENEELFTGVDGEKISFNNIEFTRRMAKADAEALAYKRILILLCGLDHRLKLFGEWYTEAQGLGFISLGFQQRWMRFVGDDEVGTLIGESRPSFREWLKARNDYLQSGSRVLTFYPNLLTSKTAPSCMKLHYGSSRDWEESIADPLTDSETKIVFKDGQDLCIEVEVKRKTWREVKRPLFNARVNLLAADSSFGFLCLDAVSADDLEWYIHNRASRVQGVAFLRLFKRAVAAIRAEETTEAAARAWMKAAVTDAGLAQADGAAELVGDAVRSWRCANRGKALPNLEDKKAFDSILSLAHSLKRTETDFVDMVEAYVVEHKLRPLRAVLTGKNRIALYVEVPPAERNVDIMEWRWVQRLSISMKPKLNETSRKLVWLTDKADAKEVDIKRWPGLDAWINAYPEPFKADYLLSVVNMVERGVPTMRSMFKGAEAGLDTDTFSELFREFKGRLWNSTSKTVPSVKISVPIAAFATYGRAVSGSAERPIDGIRVVTVRALACKWLQHFGDLGQRTKAEQTYVSIFKWKERAQQTLASPFDPDLEAVDGKTLSSIIAFDADWLHCDSLSIAQSFVRQEDGKTKRVDVERSIDEVLEAWMLDIKPEGARATNYRPSKVLVNPSAWDGKRAHLVAALDLKSKVGA
ncbi:hypothetical protein LJR175_008213 [Variovorax sp. LjRoot175]|uniref:hypothetical protein n=1 Tax=Variovorax sp. LjRoot175 TaxID=3342276 RepID=UPI003ED1606D